MRCRATTDNSDAPLPASTISGTVPKPNAAIVAAPEDPMISPSVDHLPFELGGADLSLGIEQRFPLSRLLGNRRQVALAEARVVRAAILRAELDVELEAAIAFLMLVERRAMVRIVREQLALARQVAGAASARYAAGTGSQTDLLRAEIEVSRRDRSTSCGSSSIAIAAPQWRTEITSGL